MCEQNKQTQLGKYVKNSSSVTAVDIIHLFPVPKGKSSYLTKPRKMNFSTAYTFFTSEYKIYIIVFLSV